LSFNSKLKIKAIEAEGGKAVIIYHQLFHVEELVNKAFIHTNKYLDFMHGSM